MSQVLIDDNIAIFAKYSQVYRKAKRENRKTIGNNKLQVSFTAAPLAECKPLSEKLLQVSCVKIFSISQHMQYKQGQVKRFLKNEYRKERKILSAVKLGHLIHLGNF